MKAENSANFNERENPLNHPVSDSANADSIPTGYLGFPSPLHLVCAQAVVEHASFRLATDEGPPVVRGNCKMGILQLSVTKGHAYYE